MMMNGQAEVPIGRPNELTRAVVRFMDSNRNTLILSGRTGCGKTHAATVALELSPHVGFFVTAFEASRMATWDDRLTDLTTAPGLVVLDDVGTETDTKEGRFASLLDGIINARDARRLKTVITTNLPARDFVQRYGQRVADRLRGSGTWVESNRESYRGREPRGSVSLWRFPMRPNRNDANHQELVDQLERARQTIISTKLPWVN
jgi:DNA replication protein DnaC